MLHPKQARANAPLYVVLHSAGHNVHSCLACTATVGNHDIYRSPEDFFALYLDCRANHGDWWWGSEKYKGPEVGPTEKRVIDTVKWVIKQYCIDENRVYLCGNSISRCSSRCSGWAATQRSGNSSSRVAVAPGAMAAIRRSTSVK